jgi:hypothetical protein
MTASGLLIWYRRRNQFIFFFASVSSLIGSSHINISDPFLKICKDKVEVEAWFTSLKTLISPRQNGSQPQRIDVIRSAGFSFEVPLLQQSSLLSIFFLLLFHYSCCLDFLLFLIIHIILISYHDQSVSCSYVVS